MDYLLLSGTLAPLWMLVGVYYLGRLYPNYNHRHQFMSELGARRRVTEKIQPWVNNFPIGVLFTVFGISLFQLNSQSWMVETSSILLVIHGLSHIVTGIFPCDEDLGMEKPSTSQIIHNLAGLVMYFALFITSILWVFDSRLWFSLYSGASALISFVFLCLMVRSVNSNINVGLYQRLSYGAIALWSCVLSFALFTNSL